MSEDAISGTPIIEQLVRMRNRLTEAERLKDMWIRQHDLIRDTAVDKINAARLENERLQAELEELQSKHEQIAPWATQRVRELKTKLQAAEGELRHLRGLYRGVCVSLESLDRDNRKLREQLLQFRSNRTWWQRFRHPLSR